MNDIPLVTVAIRTRNRAGYLRLAVESVLDQSYRNIDLVISDDASTDETTELCRELARADPRVRVFRHDPPLGVYANWQFCYEQGRGKYYGVLDDDNLYLPGFLEKAVSALEAAPQAAFVFADEWIIDGDGVRRVAWTEAGARRYKRAGRRSGLQSDPVMAALQGAPGINSSVIAREALVAAGGFRELAGEFADYDLFLHLASRGGAAYYLAERLTEYRDHGGQNTHKLLTSIPIVRSGVALLEAYRFGGVEERLRRQKLAIAYRSLGRACLLGGDLRAARRAIKSAWRADPTHPAAPLLLSFLYLPDSVVRAALSRRYGRQLETTDSQQRAVNPPHKESVP